MDPILIKYRPLGTSKGTVLYTFAGPVQGNLAAIDCTHGHLHLRPVVVTSQYPMEAWLERLSEPTMAEAVCDRLRHNAYTFKLKGESMRTPKSVPKVTGDE